MRRPPSKDAFEVILKYLYPDLELKFYDVDTAGNVSLTFHAKRDVHCIIPNPSDSYAMIDRLDAAQERVWRVNGVIVPTQRATVSSLRIPPLPSFTPPADSQPGTPGNTSSGTAKNAADPSAPL